MNSTFWKLVISQRIGEYIASIIVTLTYSYFLDPGLLIMYGQESDLLNIMVNTALAWAVVMTVSFYPVFMLVSYFPYLLFGNSIFLYSLSSALLSAAWSLLWLFGFQALHIFEETLFILWNAIVFSFFLVALRSFHKHVN